MQFIRNLGLSSAVFLALAGCSELSLQNRSPIQGLISSFPDPDWLHQVKSIQQVTAQSSGEPAQVGGVVQKQIPLLEQWLYQIEDASGNLWILTETPPPAVGTQITLKAEIQYEPILMGGVDIGEHYGLEIERLTTSSP